MSHQTLTDRLVGLFVEHPGEWLDGRLLAKTAGFAGWRTRVSDARRRGLDIQNRVRTVRGADGTSYRVTEYRYLPSSLLELVDVQFQQEAATC